MEQRRERRAAEGRSDNGREWPGGLAKQSGKRAMGPIDTCDLVHGGL